MLLVKGNDYKISITFSIKSCTIRNLRQKVRNSKVKKKSVPHSRLVFVIPLYMSQYLQPFIEWFTLSVLRNSVFFDVVGIRKLLLDSLLQPQHHQP